MVARFTFTFPARVPAVLPFCNTQCSLAVTAWDCTATARLTATHRTGSGTCTFYCLQVYTDSPPLFLIDLGRAQFYRYSGSRLVWWTNVVTPTTTTSGFTAWLATYLDRGWLHARIAVGSVANRFITCLWTAYLTAVLHSRTRTRVPARPPGSAGPALTGFRCLYYGRFAYGPPSRSSPVRLSSLWFSHLPGTTPRVPTRAFAGSAHRWIAWDLPRGTAAAVAHLVLGSPTALLPVVDAFGYDLLVRPSCLTRIRFPGSAGLLTATHAGYLYLCVYQPVRCSLPVQCLADSTLIASFRLYCYHRFYGRRRGQQPVLPLHVYTTWMH